jgi:hypothetical protein
MRRVTLGQESNDAESDQSLEVEHANPKELFQGFFNFNKAKRCLLVW